MQWICEACKKRRAIRRYNHPDCEILREISPGVYELDAQGSYISCACPNCAPTEAIKQKRKRDAERKAKRAK